MTTTERPAWRAALLLILGYTAYYFCRTNFSVGRPSQLAELAQGGLSTGAATVALGRIATLGVVAGICGKFFAGRIVHRLGGVWAFLLGGIGAALATAAFGRSSGIPLFGLFWVGNRLFQSVGWPATIRIVGSWFTAGNYGKAMGVVSLSWLFGDALARAGQARLLATGWDWRGVYIASAAVLLGAVLLCGLFLRERPVEPRATATPHAPVPLRELFARPAFLGVCIAAFGFTLVNVTLSEWLPVYFTGIGLSQGKAALASGLYPLMGGLSAVAFGALGDRAGSQGRQRLLIGGMLLTGATMAGFLLARTPEIAFVLVALAGLVAGGPYAYTVGAAALDLVEPKQAAAVNGIIDGMGYLGAILAGEAVARLAVALGWNGAFAALAGVCLLASGLCVVLLRRSA
ncbi:MFS transporter [Armatimonas rosea]|uniref:OPA family glycerol-3-phosphate transporter-like MFS transporter n=1 Tax=Armatimonas rosea TaxID=685828 RepID=A0A7W9W680_ARMRO|nr:OPA family glycerol-3-phosphate transporter-like MFS transporter [Armatimonas rosea]